jgi:hypothetical protein
VIGTRHRRRTNAFNPLVALLAVSIPVAIAAPAAAHLERPSYWPDPSADTSVDPPAGGAVPKARSLASAVSGKGPGEVRVVCKGAGGGNSMALLGDSLRAAVKRGYRLRPSQPKIRVARAEARALKAANRAFAKRCRYHQIQAAVEDSGNNDRVVIMPGRYTEPTSRKQPTNDPRCNPSLLQQDQSGAQTPSYEYQATCPNDQNLVYVQGRAVKGDPLPTPDPNRHGIPGEELGRCVRCNLQIEGSGVRPEDVIIDGGTGYGDPTVPTAQPSGYAKHVVMRTDRSDGFVGRNFVLRGAREHGFYTEETDGVLLDRVKFFWGADYGHLSFTTDHNVVKNCEGIGSGDAAVYPGAAPQTGDFRDEAFYPEERINTVIRDCDLHGNTLAYSGSMGNSVRVTRNHIYANTNGISSDTLSAPGHPGFPADGMRIDHNYIYSNNLDLYTDDPPFDPYVPMPIGTGIVWPGMNGGEVESNWIFDNWRHGVVLAAVPDLVAGDPEGNVDRETHCALTAVSTTSCGNRFHDNVLGRMPPNFDFPAGLRRYGNETGAGDGRVLPNGVDFWWDEFPGNNGNCWYDNTGSDGTAASVTGSGAGLPPDPLPGGCGTSVGLGDAVKEAVLLDCSMWSRGNTADDHPLCYWFRMPAQPGTQAARVEQSRWEAAAARYAASPEGKAMAERLDEIGATAFTDRP